MEELQQAVLLSIGLAPLALIVLFVLVRNSISPTQKTKKPS